MAVDSAGEAIEYSGGSWGAPLDVDKQTPLASVSCPTSGFCAAADDGGAALVWTGAWEAPQRIDGNDVFETISCPTSSYCVAVDNQGNALVYS
jgi:hypothetical protein